MQAMNDPHPLEPPYAVFSFYVHKVTDTSSSKEMYMYQRHKQNFREADQHLTDKQIQDLVGSIGELSIPYCPKSQLPTQLPPAFKKVKKCFLKQLEKQCPMLYGEFVVEDIFTYLMEEWGELRFEPGQILLLRKTNKAEMIFFIHTTRVEFSDPPLNQAPVLKHTSNREWKGQRNMLWMNTNGLIDDSKSTAAQIAAKLLEYMVKKTVGDVAGMVLGPIGAFCVDFLFGLFFPPKNPPNIADVVYKIVTKVVKEELQQNDIDTINATLSNIANGLQTVYYPRRKNADLTQLEDRQSLTDILNKYDAAFISGPSGMLGLLQNEKFQLAGLAPYILGITLRIAIYQEMATVDPVKKDGRFVSPLESSYGEPKIGTVALKALEAADYVSKVWPKVKQDRWNAVKIKQSKFCNTSVNPRTGVATTSCQYMGEVYDSVTDQHYGGQYLNDCDKDGNCSYPNSLKILCAQKQQEAVDDLTRKMDDPDSIIAKWRQLIDKPLNIAKK